MTDAPKHLVLIPTFNSGPILGRTVAQARASWCPVLVVVDGSTDGSADALPGGDILVLRRPANGGKGAAVYDGAREAHRLGYTHALVMDADGQHPADRIAGLMKASVGSPAAMVLGQPYFGADAPWPRVHGRRIANALTRALTDQPALADCLFGFRVYPIEPLLAVMAESTTMRGYDFDAEALVRLAWRGVPMITLTVPVYYPRKSAGGVSHFRYGRDNLLLTRMFLRLLWQRWRKSR